MNDVSGPQLIRKDSERGSNLGVEELISHLDEMFEDDKNHDEFFDQFDSLEDAPQ